MITTKEIEALGFVLDDKWNDKEQWLYELDNCALNVIFSDYGKTVALEIYESGYTASIELKGEVTIERITNLIKALQ